MARVSAAKASRERFKQFRKWFTTTKWYDDPVYCDIAEAAWQASERDTRERCAQIAERLADEFEKAGLERNADGAAAVAEAIRRQGSEK